MKEKGIINEFNYWNLIQKILDNSLERYSMKKSLVKHLESLPTKDIVGFYHKTQQLLNEINSSELHVIASKMNDFGCTDDGFEYFRYWLISQGKEVFYKAKKSPQFLIEQFGIGGTYSFESLAYVPVEAFENKTGEGLFEYLN